MKQGIIYCVRNPLYPHLIKIGKTTESMEKRMYSVYTFIPEEFEILFEFQVDDIDRAELVVHTSIREFKYISKTLSRNNEFFYDCPGVVAKAKDLLKPFMVKDSVVKDPVVKDSVVKDSVVKDVDDKFYCEGKGFKAVGKLTGKVSGYSEAFIVFKGSIIRHEVVLSFGEKNMELRQSLIKSGKINAQGEVLEDIEFKSPSAASSVVRGDNSNGWIVWKDAGGKTLKEVIYGLNKS